MNVVLFDISLDTWVQAGITASTIVGSIIGAGYIMRHELRELRGWRIEHEKAEDVRVEHMSKLDTAIALLQQMLEQHDRRLSTVESRLLRWP